ncbi:MAG: response regulator [Candidatus Stygibacter frigidus]|nr:response regulator [Candidatus Stygibacter frigidus]
MNRILILDDDERICDELAEYLLHRHYDVFTAGKPSLAREMLTKRDIGLVFLDINLPEMNGISFLKEIKQKYPLTKVVMISSNVSDRIINDALQRGAESFFTKPIHLSQIQEEINRINKTNGREL